MEIFITPKCYTNQQTEHGGVANGEKLDYNWSIRARVHNPHKQMVSLQQEIDQVKAKFQEAQDSYAFCCATGNWQDLSTAKKNVAKYRKQLSFLLRQRANAWDIYSFI